MSLKVGQVEGNRLADFPGASLDGAVVAAEGVRAKSDVACCQQLRADGRPSLAGRAPVGQACAFKRLLLNWPCKASNFGQAGPTRVFLQTLGGRSGRDRFALPLNWPVTK